MERNRTDVFWSDVAQAAAFDHRWSAHAGRGGARLWCIACPALGGHYDVTGAEQGCIASKCIAVCKADAWVLTREKEAKLISQCVLRPSLYGNYSQPRACMAAISAKLGVSSPATLMLTTSTSPGRPPPPSAYKMSGAGFSSTERNRRSSLRW